jgi:hypothetical protein
MTAMPIPSEEFEVLLSLATAWVEELEGDVLRRGIPLDQSQLSDARAVGVGHPERVRLLQVAQVPLPEHPLLLATCEATKAIGPRTWALSARYVKGSNRRLEFELRAGGARRVGFALAIGLTE